MPGTIVANKVGIEAGDAEAADALAQKHMRIFRSRVGALIDSSLAGDVALE